MHRQTNETGASLANLDSSWVLAHPRRFTFFSAILMVGLLAIIGIAISDAARHQYWTLQIAVFTKLNGALSTWPVFWLNMSYLCDALVLLLLLSFLIIVRPRIFAAFIGAIPLSVLLVHGGKFLANVPRPAAVLDSSRIFIVGEQLTGHNSLPSGHAATAFVAAAVLIISTSSFNQRFYKSLAVLLIGSVAVVLAFSRVAVGAHWPLDILYGAVCGYLGGISGVYLTRRYSTWWGFLKNPQYSHTVGYVLIAWSVALHFLLGVTMHDFILSIYLSSLIGLVVGIYLVMRRFLHASVSYKQYSMTLVIKYPSVYFNRTK